MLYFLMPCASLACARSLAVEREDCRIDVNVNNACPASLRAAFELAEGRVRTLQIAFTGARDDDDIVDS
jgi:hypothetical protein